MGIHEIFEYNQAQNSINKDICESLRKLIDAELIEADSKVWHGGPVWFLSGNPIVGYWVRKNGVQLLFWSGQSFDEPDLKPEGKFKAAEKNYHDASEINAEDIGRWLKKARDTQWDYKNIVKNKGHLARLR